MDIILGIGGNGPLESSLSLALMGIAVTLAIFVKSPISVIFSFYYLAQMGLIQAMNLLESYYGNAHIYFMAYGFISFMFFIIVLAISRVEKAKNFGWIAAIFAVISVYSFLTVFELCMEYVGNDVYNIMYGNINTFNLVAELIIIGLCIGERHGGFSTFFPRGRGRGDNDVTSRGGNSRDINHDSCFYNVPT